MNRRAYSHVREHLKPVRTEQVTCDCWMLRSALIGRRSTLQHRQGQEPADADFDLYPSSSFTTHRQWHFTARRRSDGGTCNCLQERSCWV